MAVQLDGLLFIVEEQKTLLIYIATSRVTATENFLGFIFAENDSIYYQNNVYQKLNDISNPNRE